LRSLGRVMSFSQIESTYGIFLFLIQINSRNQNKSYINKREKVSVLEINGLKMI